MHCQEGFPVFSSLAVLTFILSEAKRSTLVMELS